MASRKDVPSVRLEKRLLQWPPSVAISQTRQPRRRRTMARLSHVGCSEGHIAVEQAIVVGTDAEHMSKKWAVHGVRSQPVCDISLRRKKWLSCHV